VANKRSQDVEHVPILIRRAPQVMTLAADGQTHLVQVPLIAWPGPAVSKLIGIRLTKLAAPLANRFIGDRDPTRKEQLFDIPVAEAESVVKPHAMADDLDRKAVMLIAVDRWAVHAPSMAHQASARQAAQQVDNASVSSLS
jgi:hypothetical protein